MLTIHLNTQKLLYLNKSTHSVNNSLNTQNYFIWISLLIVLTIHLNTQKLLYLNKSTHNVNNSLKYTKTTLFK